MTLPHGGTDEPERKTILAQLCNPLACPSSSCFVGRILLAPVSPDAGAFLCPRVGDVNFLLSCKSFALHPKQVAVVFFP